jgi:cobalamin biosynthesis protein CobW
MPAKIPVTVITGFLGSGKTTLVRHLLTHNQGRRLAVLVNEFGELGIDGDLIKSCQACPPEAMSASSEPLEANTLETNVLEANIIELTNGCLCCTVQEEFLPTMLQLLQRRDQLDHILIETSGLALPKPLVTAFRWPEIRNCATVDGVITVVDCDAVTHGTLAADLAALEAQRQADPNLDHETPLQELFEDQLACADLVILNKADLVDAQALDQVHQLVKTETPAAVKLVTADHGQLDPQLILGFGAAVEDDLDHRPSHHDDETDHEHDDEINAVQLVFDRSFNPDRLREALAILLQQHEIYRIKGFVAVAQKSMRLVLQGVGPRFDQFYDRAWGSQEARQTKLVLIGKALDRGVIEAAIAQVP